MAAKGVSLHIGVNSVDPEHYSGWSGPLAACEADADDMLELAESRGYKSKVLKTKSATRENVLESLKSAASRLKSGDIFFLSYSGHGGQVPDRKGDEADLNDETWCLHDGQLIDDELCVAWTRFKEGVRIIVLSDSCHSGTVTRAPYNTALSAIEQANLSLGIQDCRFRCMSPEISARVYRCNRQFYDDIQRSLPDSLPPVKASVRLISGCQDNQLSLDGTFNGVFTGTMLRVWSSGRFEGHYGQFHRSIVKLMPPSQTPNHYIVGASNTLFDAQKPFQI